MSEHPAGSRVPTRLSLRHFDGRSSRPRLVEAWLDGDVLHVQGSGFERTYPGRAVQWPERTRHGPRIAQLPDGGSLQSSDAAAWDAWACESGRSDAVVVRLQQSWRAVVASLVLLVVFTVAGYVWGLPWLSREVADRLPDAVETTVGDAVLAQLDGLVEPSKLPEAEQRAIERAWQQVLAAHQASEAARGVALRPSRLLIRHSEDIGPNALALPGGAVLLTDDMVRLVRSDPQVLSGVLGHELGHVQHRHGMRMLVQVGVMGAVGSLLWGDFSGLLASVPLYLGQAHYSREAEREADAYGVKVLRASGISPMVMVNMFERLQLFQRCGDEVLKASTTDEADCKAHPEAEKEGGSGAWGLGFASHPANEERIAFFRDAAAR